MQRYKVLHGALALRRFTVAELADYIGVSQSSVHTVLDRNKSFFEKREKVSTGVRGGRPIVWSVAKDRKASLLKELEKAYPSFLSDVGGSLENDTEDSLISLEFSSLELAESLVKECMLRISQGENCDEIISLCRSQIDATKMLLSQRRLGGEMISEEFSRRVEMLECALDNEFSQEGADSDRYDQLVHVINQLKPEDVIMQDKKKYAFVFDLIDGVDSLTGKIIYSARNLGFSIVRFNIDRLKYLDFKKLGEALSLTAKHSLIFTIDSKLNDESERGIIDNVLDSADSPCPKLVFDAASETSIKIGKAIYNHGGQIVNLAHEYDPERVLASG